MQNDTDDTTQATDEQPKENITDDGPTFTVVEDKTQNDPETVECWYCSHELSTEQNFCHHCSAPSDETLYTPDEFSDALVAVRFISRLGGEVLDFYKSDLELLARMPNSYVHTDLVDELLTLGENERRRRRRNVAGIGGPPEGDR